MSARPQRPSSWLSFLALLWVASWPGPARDGASASSAEAIFGNDTYTELTVNPPRPLNSVGYLNNGCTAFLIDPDHIAAAAHCFVDDRTGAWQTDLRFYPNFHPSRVAADAGRVPRADVARVVVGSRVSAQVPAGRRSWDALFPASDWGIARVTNWRDTAGLDLTPVALARAVPTAEFAALMNPAYVRHHLPGNDNDAAAWDNMEWDTTQCGWVGPDHGMWAVRMRPAPLVDGVHRDRVGCNSRWGPGFVHDHCFVRQVANDVVLHTCDTSGGASGSPLFYRDGSGPWMAIAVTHGGPGNRFERLAGATTLTYDRSNLDMMNISPSVERFRDAPRFASAVAVGRSPGHPAATAVFAVDGDRNVVVFRNRLGVVPAHDGEFGWWTSLGNPTRAGTLGRVATCHQANGRPEVFVAVNGNRIYARAAQADGVWGAWSRFGLPPELTSVDDLDAAFDAGNRCALFVVGKGGGAFVRTRTAPATWGDWRAVAQGQFAAITAITNDDGLSWAAMLDSAGEAWRTSFSAGAWAAATTIDRPPGVPGWRDIDMTWDESGRGVLLAIPTTGGNRLLFRQMRNGASWPGWRHFETSLWAPNAAKAQDAPALRTLTASRWAEDTAGMTSPVVFATDDQGNVYVIEYTRVGTPGWVLGWKSFYHDSIAH